MDVVVVNKVLEEDNKDLVMDMVVVNKLVEEDNKVVEEVNKELVMDVMVEGVVDKEVTKVVEEVNKELVKEVTEGLVLVCRYGDGRRGDHKVDSSGEKPSACELCAKTFSCGNNLNMHLKAHAG